MKRQHRMRVLRGIRPVREQVRRWKARGQIVAFVPTMGFFHEGHLSLIRRGKLRADRVVVSIFVNPTQFGPGEDFDRYPRVLKQDLSQARQVAVDMCFVPEAKTLYRKTHRTEIHVSGLGATLEGRTRPGHFAGVALVVQKLNMAPIPPPVGFTIVDRQVEWLEGDVQLPRQGSMHERATEFLQELLGDGGALPVQTVHYLAKEEGIGIPTLTVVRRELGVRVNTVNGKRGTHKIWRMR